MNPNYRTLNNDIGMIQRTNNGWDLWFDNGDLVKAEDFHSLQVGIIIACLTSWNYMNRYGNPTYEVFGNRAYQLLKANKSSMVQYKIEQFFLECLKRMRRVYDVVSLTVSEDPYDPYKYIVEFEVISISNQLVDGSFTITTDASKSSSYIEYATYVPYASNENGLVIDLWLKNEYGGGLEDEILYMYVLKSNGKYDFLGVVGRTDETGYLRVVYEPVYDEGKNTWFDSVNGSRKQTLFDMNNDSVIFFDYHGNTTYNPTTSKRTGFKTELFSYHVSFLDDDILTLNEWEDLHIKLYKESLLDHEQYIMAHTTVTVLGSDGKIYTTTTDENGEAILRVFINGNTDYIVSYNDSIDVLNVTIIQLTPTVELSVNKTELYNEESLIMTAMAIDELGNPIKDIGVKFHDDENIIGNAMTDENGIAMLEKDFIGAGTYEITATTTETDYYTPSTSNNVGVVIRKHTLTMNGDIRYVWST